MNNRREFFVNHIQLAMSRAVDLVANERAHHALCVRSPAMITNYKQVFQLAWANRWADLDEELKNTLRTWYGHIEIVEDAASREIERDYEAAKRRSIILLADLLEAYVETLLQLMQTLEDEEGEATFNLTGRRPRDMSDSRDVRRSIRTWERSIKARSRTQRFLRMLNHYLPLGELDERAVALLDEMFTHRNALTHEIIQVSNDPTSTHVSADAASITLERVDQYFDVVGDFIISTMAAFTRVANQATEGTN